MRNRHAKHKHCRQAEVEHAQDDARSHGHRVVGFCLRSIRRAATRPELCRRHNHEEQQPRREVALYPRPDLEGQQRDKADDPDAFIDSRQHSPAIERYYRDEVEEVYKKAKVGQWCPDIICARMHLGDCQADGGCDGTGKRPAMPTSASSRAFLGACRIVTAAPSMGTKTIAPIGMPLSFITRAWPISWIKSRATIPIAKGQPKKIA